MTLGADVTFLEAREEHLAEIRRRYPSIPPDQIRQADLETGIRVPRSSYDLILHMGVLYHLDNWKVAILNCGELTNNLVLETEVCDAAADDFEIKSPENGPDHAFSGVSTRPSEFYVERIIEQSGFLHQKITDERCNSDFHVYDWPNTNSLTWRWGLRRFWFCRKPSP
jgi:hypothetical protein